MLLALGIAFVLDHLDDTVKSPDDVETTTGLPTLGTITKMRGGKDRSEIYRLATLLSHLGPVAEAYRSLRTSIEFAGVDTPVRSLLVTSAIPGEGKTTTAANVAVVFAQAGRRTILLDADFRKPGIHRIFDLPNAHGLSSMLRTRRHDIRRRSTEHEQETCVSSRRDHSRPTQPNSWDRSGCGRSSAAWQRLGPGGHR